MGKSPVRYERPLQIPSLQHLFFTNPYPQYLTILETTYDFFNQIRMSLYASFASSQNTRNTTMIYIRVLRCISHAAAAPGQAIVP